MYDLKPTIYYTAVIHSVKLKKMTNMIISETNYIDMLK